MSTRLTKKDKTEFELLLSNEDLIPNTDTDLYPLTQVLDNKVLEAVREVVDFVLLQNSGKSTHTTLQNIVSKIPSTVYAKYSRSGKNYITLEHKLGYLGNVFFSDMFARLAQENSFTNNYTILEQNKVCFIYRQ